MWAVRNPLASNWLIWPSLGHALMPGGGSSSCETEIQRRHKLTSGRG